MLGFSGFGSRIVEFRDFFGLGFGDFCLGFGA